MNGEEKAEPDLFINCLFVLALESLRYICIRTQKSFEFEEILIKVKQAIKANFYHTQDGLFSVTQDGKEYTELGNSLAVLCGILSKEENETICKKLVGGGLIECSLSMKTWKYETLLLCDKEKYKGQVLDEIRSTYKIMLDAGATSEDEKEIFECFKMLIDSTAGTGLMHEGVDCNDVNIYSRSWFAWANSMFAYFVLKKIDTIKKFLA